MIIYINCNVHHFTWKATLVLMMKMWRHARSKFQESKKEYAYYTGYIEVLVIHGAMILPQ